MSRGEGNDTVFAGSGGDAVAGDAGNDHLFGGTGNNVLRGGARDEHLGGEGNGRARWRQVRIRSAFAPGSGVERIEDFEVGVDIIDLTAIVDSDDIAEVSAASSSSAGGLRIDLGGRDVVVIASLDRGDEWCWSRRLRYQRDSWGDRPVRDQSPLPAFGVSGYRPSKRADCQAPEREGRIENFVPVVGSPFEARIVRGPSEQVGR